MNILNRFLVISLLASGLSAELFAKQAYVLVEREGKDWVVDLTGHPEFSTEIASTERAQAQKNPNGGLVVLNRPQFPSFLKKLQKMSIMTKSGNKQLSLKGTALLLVDGLNHEFTFPLVGDPGIDTHAIGSLNAPFPRNAYLRDLKTSSGKDHGAVADKIWKGFLATADKDLLKILKMKKNKMDANRLRFAKTKLRDKYAWIVWLSGQIETPDGGLDELSFSVIVDANGNILNPDSFYWKPLFVSDLNGDGKEEIIVHSSSDTNNSTYILEFKDKAYTTTNLTQAGC